MNVSFIMYIIGWIISIESVAMLLPALVGLIYQENEGWCYLVVAVISMIVGLLLIRKKPEKTQLYAREGFAVVGLSWIVLSLIGALPLYFSGEMPVFINALFDIVSGFTTTGATTRTEVESFTHVAHFWRCFSHWIGGMGVFVFLLVIMPLTGGNNIHLMRAESPGPQVGKLVPKLRDTSKILYLIYFALTVLTFILLIVIGRMPVFDSMLLAFGTAGTGGFGLRNDSIGSYNDAVQWIITIFMILFGVNFNFYFFLLGKNKKEAFKMEEVRWYLIVILAAIGVISFNIRHEFSSIYECIKQASFHVGSLVTSTGFAMYDYNTWPTLAKTILVSLMFMGACAGSTGGGIKVSRFVILLKTVKQEIYSYVHPRSIKTITLDGKAVEKSMIKGVLVYFGLYAIIYVISLLIISIDGFDITTNFTAVVACICNIGPGLEMVGPAGNFGDYSVLSKCVLIFDMLAGRLEFYPMLVLFAPSMWKK